MKALLSLALGLLLADLTSAATSDERQPAEPQLRLTPSDVAGIAKTHSGAGTSGLAGIQTTVLEGDPTKTGLYVIAIRVPANTRIEAHSHRDDRSAVVVSGTWYFGYGARADDVRLKTLPPGSFYTEPAGVSHFARTRNSEVIVYITGFGPTDTKYDAAPNE